MRLRTLFRRLWHFIREAAGENAYLQHRERALAHGESPLPPAAFYLSGLERKYSRPNRCC